MTFPVVIDSVQLCLNYELTPVIASEDFLVIL